MLRFPNPGSTIEHFIAVYTAAYKQLSGKVIDLDDIVAAVVGANLATSSGYVGQEAIARSTRADRSRDPLYNQVKMYAEIFRSLGWLHPTEAKSLNYTFTLLGRQVVEAGKYWLPLFQECILGIVYPNNVLDIKGDFNQRPFAFILTSMRKLGGYLSRDEMILGPLSASSDRSTPHKNAVLRQVQLIRKSPKHVEKALEELSKNRKIQINTLKNYTRWPIAVLRDARWVEETTVQYESGHKYKVFRLTPEGIAVTDALEKRADIRLDQYERLRPDQKRALGVHTHYSMLERTGFDVSSVTDLLDETRGHFANALAEFGFKPDVQVVFSPFQTISLSDINRIFPVKEVDELTSPATKDEQGIASVVGRNSRDHLFVRPKFTARGNEAVSEEASSTRRVLEQLIQKHKSIDKAVAEFSAMHRYDTKEQFYPLITHLFQIMGYRSEKSRAGVNYQRWDACVWVTDTVIPIEIKSPTEELVLSTKSIRQALENKVISLSRGGVETKPEDASLIVGFDIPNVRSEMGNLIDDIFKTYRFRIGVLSIHALTKLTIQAIQKRERISPEQLSAFMGFLDV